MLFSTGRRENTPLFEHFFSSLQDEINEYSLSLPVCVLYFLNATLTLFSKAIRVLEIEYTLSINVYEVMLEVNKQVENRNDNFYRFEVNMPLEHLKETEKHIPVKECTVVYHRLL